MDRQKVCIFAALFILAYFPTLGWMWDRWFAYDTYYSHGILVPLTTILLIWQKRQILKDIPSEPSPLGMWVFALGIFIHALSLLLGVYFTSGFSMIIVLAGFVLTVWGKVVFRKILFPLLFLVFMVPLPLVLTLNLSFNLKLLSAQLAAVMLNVINFPAIQQGSYIHLQHATVVVEDVCSGLRSLIALLAVGALFAYWMKAGRLKKMVLLCSSIPIAVVTNMLRIMILAVISEIWGTQYASGLFHEISGLLVFVLAFLLLSLVERLLKQVPYAQAK